MDFMKEEITMTLTREDWTNLLSCIQKGVLYYEARADYYQNDFISKEDFTYYKQKCERLNEISFDICNLLGIDSHFLKFI